VPRHVLRFSSRCATHSDFPHADYTILPMV
jgi:hypothetical protein